MYVFSRVTQRIGHAANGVCSTGLCDRGASRHFAGVSLYVEAQRPILDGALDGQLVRNWGYSAAMRFTCPSSSPPRGCGAQGMSFCYNVGRYVAATSPISITFLRSHVFVSWSGAVPDPPAAAMCSCYLIGLVEAASIRAPRRRGSRAAGMRSISRVLDFKSQIQDGRATTATPSFRVRQRSDDLIDTLVVKPDGHALRRQETLPRRRERPTLLGDRPRTFARRATPP